MYFFPIFQQYLSKQVSLIFAGDFNSTPEFEVYRLMTSQMAGFDDIEWAESKHFDSVLPLFFPSCLATFLVMFFFGLFL